MEFEERLKKLYAQLTNEYVNNIQPYWAKYPIDTRNGGFVGQVNYQNVPDQKANKSGILNARILWTFSNAYKIFENKDSETLAHRAYHEFLSHFIDDDFGGIYWEIDPKGEVTDSRKHVYAQAFAIYGLVEYFSAFGNKEALQKANEICQLIEEKCSDPVHGGYFEAYSREWELNDDVRLSEKDENEPKSMNTHLHVLEAYTNLYRYDPTPQLEISLRKLIQLFFDQIITKDGRTLHCFFSEDWTPKSEIVSFGHDIETSWLLTEAIEVLGDHELLKKMEPIAESIADHVLLYGMDPDGGLINELNLNSSTNDYAKDWWPQAEALVGFMNAFQITGNPKYLEAVFQSWNFIQNFIIDHEKGEWFEKVNRKGIPYRKLDKVRSWKAPYHNSRAIFELRKRITEYLKNTSSKLPNLNVNGTVKANTEHLL